MKTYTVQRGDSLSLIASRQGLSLAQIIAYNPEIKDPNLIYPGQVIKLEPPTTVYGPMPAPAPAPQTTLLRPVPAPAPRPAPVKAGFLSALTSRPELLLVAGAALVAAIILTPKKA